MTDRPDMPRTEVGRALLKQILEVAWFDDETDYAAQIRAIEEIASERDRLCTHCGKPWAIPPERP